MKITIEIPDELAMRAKKLAVALRSSFRGLVIKGLRARLDTEQYACKAGSERTIRWVCHEGGLPPSVNLADRAKMTEWLRFH